MKIKCVDCDREKKFTNASLSENDGWIKKSEGWLCDRCSDYDTSDYDDDNADDNEEDSGDDYPSGGNF